MAIDYIRQKRNGLYPPRMAPFCRFVEADWYDFGHGNIKRICTNGVRLPNKHLVVFKNTAGGEPMELSGGVVTVLWRVLFELTGMIAGSKWLATGLILVTCCTAGFTVIDILSEFSPVNIGVMLTFKGTTSRGISEVFGQCRTIVTAHSSMHSSHAYPTCGALSSPSRGVVEFSILYAEILMESHEDGNSTHLIRYTLDII